MRRLSSSRTGCRRKKSTDRRPGAVDVQRQAGRAHGDASEPPNGRHACALSRYRQSVEPGQPCFAPTPCVPTVWRRVGSHARTKNRRGASRGASQSGYWVSRSYCPSGCEVPRMGHMSSSGSDDATQRPDDHDHAEPAEDDPGPQGRLAECLHEHVRTSGAVVLSRAESRQLVPCSPQCWRKKKGRYAYVKGDS